ncbi:MAG: ATP-binding protein [Lachnospiraceae bacterium]|nr:ATP-binding protein [Lachnospiraceae bacterium]
MKRLLLKKLIEWKDKKHRKPLILWGARQVGKTWLMKEFGSSYFSNFVYISFYNNSRMSSIFEEDYDAKRIINAIEVNQHVKITPGETLLIFDEVQTAPKVVESLKYFCEDAPEYPVMAAGSLLGVSIHEGVSFPVGKVDEFHLYPMNFREFLLAMGEDRLFEYVSNADYERINEFSTLYKELLKQYLCVGGMPEVVERFVEKHDFSEVRELQLAILSQYEGDFGKHVSSNEMPRIRMTWQSLPMQLAKENKKFFFGQVKEGARQKDFEKAIQWLVDAGLVYKVNKVQKPAMPLKSYVDFSSFKLFLIDVGLLGALSELDIESVIQGNDLFVEFKGALIEQYVLEQLMSDTQYTPYYYSGEKSTYETDFLIQKRKDVVPIEVKAETNLKSKSLRAYYDKFLPALALRVSSSDYIDQGWMKNIPLWCVSAI